MSHMTCHNVLLAHGCLMGIAFVFRVCIKNHRVHILSLDTNGHGMMWQRILLHSHGIHVHMGLMNILSSGFT